MCSEIEAKLKVDSLEKVVEKLKSLKAEFLSKQHQLDYYFDNKEAELRKSDRALRLRKQTENNNVKIFLTYKGAKQKNNYKQRQEIEIEIPDPDSMEMLLNQLGYKIAATVEKTREIWRLEKCLTALDRLPSLGSFVEIEGPDNRQIGKIQYELGLSHLPHIAKSYVELKEIDSS